MHRTLMNRRKREESLQEYILVTREIATREEIEAEVTIQYIVDGIVKDVNNKVLLYSATMFEQLKENIKLYNLVKSKTAYGLQPEQRRRKTSVIVGSRFKPHQR